LSPETTHLNHHTDCEHEDLKFYGDATSSGSLVTVGSFKKHVNFVFKVEDSIPVIGSILHGMFSSGADVVGLQDELRWGRDGFNISDATTASTAIDGSINAPNHKFLPLSSTAAAAYIVEREAKDSLHVVTGAGQIGGAVCRVASGLRLSKIATRDFIGASTVASIVTSFDRIGSKSSEEADNDRNRPEGGDSSPEACGKISCTLLFLSYASPTVSAQHNLQRTRVLAVTSPAGKVAIKELVAEDLGV
jgi:hypothetical protein